MVWLAGGGAPLVGYLMCSAIVRVHYMYHGVEEEIYALVSST